MSLLLDLSTSFVSSRTVCIYFANISKPRRPMLFGIMSAGSDKVGATHSFAHKLYQVLPKVSTGGSGKKGSGHRLKPMELHITNLGASRQARSYDALSPVSALPSVQLPTPGSSVTGEICYAEAPHLDL